MWVKQCHKTIHTINQWPFQDPKLEVPTIYKAYFSGLCKGISPQNMAWNMVQYLHFRIRKFPLNKLGWSANGSRVSPRIRSNLPWLFRLQKTSRQIAPEGNSRTKPWAICEMWGYNSDIIQLYMVEMLNMGIKEIWVLFYFCLKMKGLRWYKYKVASGNISAKKVEI